MNTAKNEIEIFNNTIRAFYKIKCEISNVKNDYPISRRQGKDLENAFIMKILEIIKSEVNGTSQQLSKPFLYFSSDPNDSFEKINLISFINNEINTLSKMKIINNLTICDYYNKFECRLLELI